MTTPLTIVSLDITNFARIRAVKIEPDPSGAVIISGNNAQGKSSVLNAIAAVIDASKYKVPVPVHVGADAADVVAVLGRDGIPELVVTWHQDASGKKWLDVKDPIGRKKSSPASLMKSLFGYLAVNPFAFAQSSGKDQIRTLLQSTGFDIDSWDAERNEIFSARTEVNRDVTRSKKVLESLREPKAGVPDTIVSATGLIEERSQLLDRQRAAAEAERSVTAWEERVTALRAQLAEARNNAVAAREYRDSLGFVPADLDERLEEIDRQLADIDATNEEVRTKQQYIQAFKDFNANNDESNKLTQKLKQHDAKLQKAMTSIDLPVTGLSFEDDELKLNGVPFSAASHAEKLTIGTALAIAAQPQAGVILIEDGSLMDENTTAIITGMAEKYGMQVWIEAVGTEDGFVIEDGELRG